MITFRPDVLQLDACHRDVAEERCFVDSTSSLLGQVSHVWDIINISIYQDDSIMIVYLDVRQNDAHHDMVSPDDVHHMARNLADKRVDVFEERRAE